MQHKIAVLAFDDVVALDLGAAPQVFNAARNAAGEHLYEVRVCTLDGAPVRSSAGFRMVPDHGIEALTWADTVAVAGVHGGSALTHGTLEPAAVQALRACVARGTRLMSICTGAFVLAAAGLLDGRPATTHWRYAARFARFFPAVRLNQDVLFVDDGDILSSAGVAAGLDLCLHVVRRDHGSAVANRAARSCVIPAWREGGQSQFIECPLPGPAEASTGATRVWALERLDDQLDLTALAAHAGMSVRTFTRRFREENGLSPGRWLLQQRIERARYLLETTDLPVDQIAHRSGFGTGAALRLRLHEALGVAPSAYRRAFRPVG